MLINILVNLLGIFIFLFIFWKKLKEDYTAGMIFTSAFYILSLLGVGLFISKFFFARFWFWTAFTGLAIGFAISIFRFKLRFFETIEAVVPGFLAWLGLVFLRDSVVVNSLTSFLAFFVSVSLLVLYYFLDAHYKNFTWYASGRVGFSSLFTLGLFFLIRSSVASFFPFVLSFSGKYEVIVSGVLAFTFFLLTYNLTKNQA